MSLLNKSKQETIAEFAREKNDTGCPEVQCAIITRQMESLTEHMKVHKKDHSSKRGLLALVGKRRRILDHLKKEDSKRYEALIKKLNIRK
jgi:small subunit ribosomal protein S15